MMNLYPQVTVTSYYFFFNYIFLGKASLALLVESNPYIFLPWNTNGDVKQNYILIPFTFIVQKIIL